MSKTNKLQMSYSFLYYYAFLLNSLSFLLYPIIWENSPIKLKTQWGNFPK